MSDIDIFTLSKSVKSVESDVNKNMKKYLLLLTACVLTACEKPYIADDDGDEPSVVVPGYDEQRDEVLWAENDTARFYLQGVEISGVVLADCPTPSDLISNPRYRLPTRLEVSRVLKFADMPEDYWQSGQRILCYDDPRDKDVKVGSTWYGTGDYYTFTPHSTVTHAGMKTKYCILPIRSERTRGKEGVDITVRDEWE